jgi:hypothetical protein
MHVYLQDFPLEDVMENISLNNKERRICFRLGKNRVLL